MMSAPQDLAQLKGSDLLRFIEIALSDANVDIIGFQERLVERGRIDRPSDEALNRAAVFWAASRMLRAAVEIGSRTGGKDPVIKQLTEVVREALNVAASTRGRYERVQDGADVAEPDATGDHPDASNDGG